MFANTDFSYFQKNQLDCIDIEDIENLEDSPRLVFIDEECGNLIVVNDGAELTRNIKGGLSGRMT